MLDILFVSRGEGRVVYCTYTEASATQSGEGNSADETAITRVIKLCENGEGHEELTEVAALEWNTVPPRSVPTSGSRRAGDGLRSAASSSNRHKVKRTTIVSMGGERVLANEYLRKARGIFSSE